MISKESFCKLLNDCEKFYGQISEVMDLLDMNPENFIFKFFDSILDSLVDEIEKDKYVYDPMIFSWAFTYNWGKDYRNSFLIKIDDVEYKPATAEELYDVLIKTYYDTEGK